MLASRLHANQKRKSKGAGQPDICYLSHLLGVASLVLGAGRETSEAIPALLHDAIEDQEASEPDIESSFGPRTLAIVKKMTDVAGADEGPRTSENSLQRKAAHREELGREKDEGVRVVALADKLHNARCTLEDYRRDGEVVWERFNVTKEQKLADYRLLAEALQGPPNAPLAKEFAATVEELLKEAGVVVPPR